MCWCDSRKRTPWCDDCRRLAPPPPVEPRLDTPIVPRRIDMGRLTPAERAIHDAILAVEALPADPRLTSAVVSLIRARSRVADFIDNIL